MINLFLFVLQLFFTTITYQQYITPTSYPGYVKLSTYSIGDLITDSTINPSETIIYVATYYKGITAFSLDHLSIFNEFTPLYSFKTTGHPILIESLGDEYIFVVSNTTNGQLIELYKVTDSSEYLKTLSNVLNSSDIRDVVVSKDHNYIYGVDYQSGFFSINVTDKSQIIWNYKNENWTNMQSTNIVLTNNGSFVYFFTYKDLLDNDLIIVNITNLKNITYANSRFQGSFSYPITGLIISSSDIITVMLCTAGFNDFLMIDYFGNSMMTSNTNYQNNQYFKICHFESQQAFASIGDNYIVSGLTSTQILNTTISKELNFAQILPIYSWNPSSTKIHVLSNSYIIQENGLYGELYFLLSQTTVPSLTILNRYMYVSSEINSLILPGIPGSPIWQTFFGDLGWNSISCVLKINPTTLFIGLKMSSFMIPNQPSAFLCNFTIQSPTINVDSRYFINGQNYYIDLNNLMLSSNGYYDTLNMLTYYAFLDISGKYLFTYSTSGGYALWHLNIYDAKQTETLVLLQRLDNILGAGDDITSVSMTQLGEVLYYIPFGTITVRNCIQSLNFSNITNATIVPTEICVNQIRPLQTGLAACTLNNTLYIFYKFSSDPYLHVGLVSPTQFWNITDVSLYFMDDSVQIMVANSTCSYLYTGGDSFKVFDVSNPLSITMTYKLNIPSIQSIRIATFNLLYIITTLQAFVLDITKPLFPNQISYYQIDNFENTLAVSDFITDTQNNGIYIFVGESAGDLNGENLNILHVGQPPMYLLVEILSDKLYIGVTTIYPFKYQIMQVMFDLCVTDLDGKYLILTPYLLTKSFEKKTLPLWIYVDTIEQTIIVTPPKENINQNIAIYFECNFTKYKSEVTYSLIVTLPYVYSSLSINSTSKKFQIDSPSENSLTLTIDINSTSIVMIVDSFNGVLITYAKGSGSFIGFGNLNNLNEMLTKLRYACLNNSFDCQSLINITISDGINYDQKMINQPLIYLNQDIAPYIALNNNIQNQLERMLKNKNFEITPNVDFLIQIYSKTYIDTDPLTYTLFPHNQSNNLPSWLIFDPLKLQISGTPSFRDEGNLALVMNVTDNYYYILDEFTLNIFDNPPHIDVPLSQQLNQSQCVVGEIFSLSFLPFLDSDGPDSLIYMALVIIEGGKKFILDDNSKFWLHFDSHLRILSGSPTNNDTGSINVSIIANDGLKNTTDSFKLSIYSSLDISYGQSGFPVINSNVSTNIIQVKITSNSSKIILPITDQNFINLLYFYESPDLKEIVINATVNDINSALKYLTFREVRNKTASNNSNSTYINLNITDSFNQAGFINFNISSLKDDSLQLIVHPEYASNEYLAEIGTFFKVGVSKTIFNEQDKIIQLNYSFILLNKFGTKQDFIIMDQDLNLVSLKSIDETYLGTYNAIINATDEFNDYAVLYFTINVNYSLSTIIQQWFVRLSGLLSSLISIIAIYKFYYIFFNLWFNKSNEMNDEIQIIDRYFKRKYAFIKTEYDIALKVYSKYMKKNKKSKDKIPQNQLQIDNQIQEMMRLIPYKYKIKDVLCETVECILEGLIINNMIEHTPFVKDIFYLMKSIVQLKLKDKSAKKQWFSHFFISVLSISNKVELKFNNVENFSKIDKYVIQKGKYKVVEKHLFFNEEMFNSFYGTAILKIKKKSKKYDKLDSKIIRDLIIKAIIIYKRGILLDNYRIFRFLNKIFSKLTLNCISFVHGDSIHANEESIKNISAKWKDEGKTDTFDCYHRIFMKTNFFSLSNRTVPFWIKVEQKRGIIIIKGVSIIGEQDHHYKLEVIGPNQKNLFHFWIKIYKDQDSLYKVDKVLCSTITIGDSITRKKTLNTYALDERAREFKKKYRLNTRKQTLAAEDSFNKTRQIIESTQMMSPDYIEEKEASKQNIKIEMSYNPSPTSTKNSGNNSNRLMTERFEETKE